MVTLAAVWGLEMDHLFLVVLAEVELQCLSPLSSVASCHSNVSFLLDWLEGAVSESSDDT